MKPHSFFKDRYDEIFKDEKHIPETRIGKFFSDHNYFDPWGQFVFRGQSNAAWKLETAIFRHDMRSGKNRSTDLKKIERMALREFQRQYKRLGTAPIDADAYHEWFAIMQHHGAPTRLLDFTYSFYVALYFASKDISFHDKDFISFSIYAINYFFVEYKRNTFLTKKIRKKTEGHDGDSQMKTPEIQRATVKNLDKKGILLVTPFHLNTRLVRQRGTFLMPTDLRNNFMENLNSILVDECGAPVSTKVIKITVRLNYQEVHYLYRQLHYMNISAQTLFEDSIDALGETIKMKIFTAKYTDMLADNEQGNIEGA
jgi:hypothetical protein